MQDADIQRVVVYDACLISGFEKPSIMKVLEALPRYFTASEQHDLRRTLVNELIAAERERPFALEGGVLIPHIPVESMCRAGWFRSVDGVPTGDTNQERAYIIFCAMAPDHVLRIIMGYVCEMLREDAFRHQFRCAETANSLRQAIVSHFRAHFERHALGKDQLRERAITWAHRLWNSPEDNEVFVTDAFIHHRRGLDARFAAKVTKMIRGFDCEVVFSARGSYVSGRSILGLMMLALGPGNVVEVIAKGPDAEELVKLLPQVLEEKFPY